MHWLIAFLGSLLLFSTVAFSSSPSSTVTIPIDEYLSLKRHDEQAKVTSIEEVRLKGRFGKPLTLTIAGRCAGGLQPRPVLETNENFSLSGCKGEAMLNAGEEGIELVPLASRFTLTCEVRSKNWNEFELEILNAFSFTGEVSGAEVISESSEDQHRKVSLTPTERERPTQSGGQVTGVAKYRITVEPEQVSFRYLFKLDNPGRGTRSYQIQWLNGEIVQKARGLASTEEGSNVTKFNLNPGSNEIEVNGRFPGMSFKPLLPSEQQYLLLESHPTLQLSIEGKGRRLSLNDPALRPRYTNARLYVFGKNGEFSWSTRKLEVQEAMGFSVTSAHYSYYVPEFGRPIVDVHFALNNQGTPEVPLEVPGTATYLEVNGEPQVLYKSPEGKLLVQVPSGGSNVYLQYRSDKDSGALSTFHKAELVKPNTVLSNVSVNLLTPSKWKVLFGASLIGVESDYDTGACVVALLLGLLLYGAARLWRFGLGTRRMLGLCGAILGFIGPETLLFFLAFGLVLGLARYRVALWTFFRMKPIRGLILVAAIALPAMILLFSLTHALIGTSRQIVGKGLAQYNDERPSFRQGAPSGEAGGAGTSPAQAKSDDGGEAESIEPTAQTAYQGLPAKIEIPYGTSATAFSQTLVDNRGKVVLRAWLVSRSVINSLFLVFLGVSLFTLWKKRREILHWTMAPV